VSLHQELSSISPADFAANFDVLTGAVPPAAKAPKPKATKVPKDSPVTRVAKVLRDERGLSDDVAKSWLITALIKDGISPQKIPPTQDVSLEVWLTQLFKKVSSATANDLAKTA
jgi:hypothetical protein